MTSRSAAVPPALTSELEQQVLDFVVDYDHAFNRAAAVNGLSGAQACALNMLGDAQPMNALAHALACDASNATQIVARLEARGLAVRTAGATDRRVKHVVVTDEGRAMQAALAKTFAFAREALANLDEDEQAQLGALLRKMAG